MKTPLRPDKRQIFVWFAIAGLWTVIVFTAAFLVGIKPWRRIEIYAASVLFAFALSCIAWRNKTLVCRYGDAAVRVIAPWWRVVLTIAAITAFTLFTASAVARYQVTKARNLA